jgi:uncharacterized protein (TIGR03437 family)
MPLPISRLFATALLFAPLSLAQVVSDCSLPEVQVKLNVQNTPSTALPGQSVKYAIFVAPVANAFDPTGALTFSDVTLTSVATDLGSAKLAFGQTTFSTTFYTAGTHRLLISYSGDNTYCPLALYFTQAVDRLTPAISLAASSLAVTAGAQVTLTAQIGVATPVGVAPPVGPVQFLDNGAVIGTGDIAGAKATFSTAKLGAGFHQITAVLVGDLNYYSVRSSPLGVTVSPATTFTLLSATATATDVTFKVTVNANSVSPQTGTVTLVDTTSNSAIATLALPGASITLPVAKVPAGRPIAAVYTEGTNYASSTSAPVTFAAFLNAAGAPSSNIAPDEIVSLFGGGFAGSTLQGSGTQLPTTLGGVTVTIADRNGTSRSAPLYLASPTQINFIVPSATGTGPATLTVSGASANIIPIQLTVANVAPGLFNPGPQVLHVSASGAQSLETVTGPITLDPAPGITYLVLFSTGVRNRSSLSAVTALVGNITLAPDYVGAQSQFPGLDQVNILLPDSLKGAGKINLTLTVDSQQTNAIPLQFQ